MRGYLSLIEFQASRWALIEVMWQGPANVRQSAGRLVRNAGQLTLADVSGITRGKRLSDTIRQSKPLLILH